MVAQVLNVQFFLYFSEFFFYFLTSDLLLTIKRLMFWKFEFGHFYLPGSICYHSQSCIKLIIHIIIHTLFYWDYLQCDRTSVISQDKTYFSFLSINSLLIAVKISVAGHNFVFLLLEYKHIDRSMHCEKSIFQYIFF